MFHEAAYGILFSFHCKREIATPTHLRWGIIIGTIELILLFLSDLCICSGYAVVQVQSPLVDYCEALVTRDSKTQLQALQV